MVTSEERPYLKESTNASGGTMLDFSFLVRLSFFISSSRALGSSIDRSNSNEDGSAPLIGKDRLPSPVVGEWGKQPGKESGSKRTDWNEDYLGVRALWRFDVY
jgi:hypothetical protein